MKKLFKSIIATILVVSMILATSVVAFADSSIQEEYISDLRLIYADTYEEAKLNLTDSKLEGYKILNNNLNAYTGKTGVWLAYKTTTNVDDTITDISIMQMGGGYNAANYQAMIEKSRGEYEAMGEIYLDAIDYFAEAYDAGNFLAEAAYRQLNFYAGLDKYKETRLGDLFVDGVLKKTDLATLFFEGNAKVLDNVRSLLAMGVSYNEEGLTYLQRVSLLASGSYSGYIESNVADVTANDIVVSETEDIDVLAAFIASNISTFRTMFEELSAYESELNYEDDEFTDLELEYAEYKAVAEMMRAVDYLNGQSLYDFCMSYSVDTKDYSSLYPLARALNDGQISLTKVGHFYDVVRYSMSDAPEDTITAQLDELELQYAEKPFDVYTGVDRDMYKGTFALTSAAYRAEAYTDNYSLAEALFGNGAWASTTAQITAGAVGAGLFIWAIVRSVKGHTITTETTVEIAAETIKEKAVEAANALAKEDFPGFTLSNEYIIDTAYDKLSSAHNVYIAGYDDLPFSKRPEAILEEFKKYGDLVDDDGWYERVKIVNDECNKKVSDTMAKSPSTEVHTTTTISWSGRIFTGLLYIAGAVSLAYSAISLYNKIYDHYHPKYDEIPTAMVDLVKTADGDRYIKYDVALDTTLKDGEYHAADLNAFAGERWNAIYYTKNSEAGKPLLADFEVSNSDNRANEGYLAVSRFGEVICYDLNKYNFSSDSAMIFLSVRQSENLKSDYADVPNVVGSIFGSGFWVLAGCVGVIVGVGGTMLTNSLLNKKKSKKDNNKEILKGSDE